MKIKTTSKKLKNIVSAISKLEDEARFIPKEDSLKIETVDSDIVGLVFGEIPEETLKEYEEGERDKIGLNISKLNSFLGRSRKEVVLKTEDNKLVINIGENRTFKIPILKSIEQEGKLEEDMTDDLDYSDKAEVKIKVKELRKAIKDASIFSETAQFEVENEELRIKGEGETSKAEFIVKDNSDITIEGEADSLYSNSYLKKMLKGGKIANRVVLNLKEDYPLRAEFEDDMKLKYVIAPRIEEE